MAVLEQVLNMKRQGIPEQQIADELSQKYSPREINDALKQAQIKNAVSDYGNPSYGNDMQPSTMPEQEYMPSSSPESQEYQPQQYAPAVEEQQTYAPQEQTYQPQEQQQYYTPSASQTYGSMGIDADTVMEIADQVFSEKTKKIQKQLDATSEAAIMLKTKTENISDRLKKIETIIDKLQIAILEKIGSYGQDLRSIKKEMSMMQDSFSKMVSLPKKTKKK